MTFAYVPRLHTGPYLGHVLAAHDLFDSRVFLGLLGFVSKKTGARLRLFDHHFPMLYNVGKTIIENCMTCQAQ